MSTLEEISTYLQKGDEEKVAELTRTAIKEEVSTQEILEHGLIGGMNVIGKRFREHEIFLPDVLLAASQDASGRRPALSAINIGSGREIWRTQLPACAVKGGLAVNHRKQIFIALENGQVHCYEKRSGD